MNGAVSSNYYIQSLYEEVIVSAKAIIYINFWPCSRGAEITGVQKQTVYVVKPLQVVDLKHLKQY